MFAALFFERDPLRLADLPAGLIQWVQVAGGFAAFGLILWFLLGLPRLRKEDLAGIPGWQKLVFLVASLLSGVCYLVFFSASAAAMVGTATSRLNTTAANQIDVASVAQTAAGALALLAVCLPFLRSVMGMRFRRIFALARLSFKEAIRRRVLYAFSAMLLIFLFASWFIPAKPEDQVRTYVGVVFTAMGYLMLITAVLLAAFSIPADIKQQTIHTIVTKPVERFEIILGRFLGFLALMTVVLVFMTALSLLYILREIHPFAVAESLKARVPLYGELRFENTDNERAGVNVGREWEYRSYITRPLPGQEPNTARYDFYEIPSALSGRQEVRCEYTFDVYRTTKGEENKDVACTFRFYTWRFRKGNDEAYRKERKERGQALRDLALDNELTEKYGYYEINSLPVTDYRTQFFTLPGGLFRNALAADPERTNELKQRGESRPALLQIRITSDSAAQYVGMARYDLYVRVDEPGVGEQWLFALNFFKGVFGLWLQIALVIGLAVTLSTYLNGPITLMLTLLLFFGGWSRGFIEEVALGRNASGGPTEAMVRILRRELTGPSMADSSSIGDRLVYRSDQSFRFVIKLVINAIPDVERLDFTSYVAEGFNISTTQMGLDLLLLCGYLVPWFVLSYYLIRWREIASST